ncbi:MAG: hypothetical protein M9916_08215 [Crocinitomicaceae bacterium]|nr:hypothetical protein [Crocinitomicaceae bacterium]
MKKSILCIALGLTATTVDAQCDTTYLSGNQLISTDTTLSGVYSISGNFTIEEGITVMVKPYSTGGCGTLKVIANNITIKGTINGDYAGYLGGNAGAGATNVTSSTGHTNSLVACEDKDNSGAVTVYGGGAGLVGNGSGAGNAGQNGTNGSGSKQVCGNTDDTYGMIGGAGGAGGGGGAS